jgi:hypothetical protein
MPRVPLEEGTKEQGCMSEPISRRKFLTMLVVVAGGTTFGGMIVRRWRAWCLAPAQALYARLAYPEIKDAPPGRLDIPVLQALVATTEALVGTPVETSHYEDFFRWHSEHLRGYKSLYEQFTAVLNHGAEQAGRPDFARCDMATRRQILDKFPLARQGEFGKLLRGVFQKDGRRFEYYIVREILELFNRTDAWIVLGYESWPGTPRGLDKYTQPPGKA